MNGKQLLVVLLVLVLLVVGMVALGGKVFSPPSSPPVVRWKGVAAPAPLEVATQKAGERAIAWQPDAVLVRVEASFRPGTRWLETRLLPVNWLFTYYSPSAGALATVAVNAEKTLWIPPMEVSEPPQPLPAFPPPYGVDQMWLTFRGAGGEEFLSQHPGAMVHIALQMEEGAAVWQVSAVEKDAYFAVRIDAETGTVLPERRRSK